jgi:hypothetical protein
MGQTLVDAGNLGESGSLIGATPSYPLSTLEKILTLKVVTQPSSGTN